jgi:tetratricopeptide (TPR) repeat protein
MGAIDRRSLKRILRNHNVLLVDGVNAEVDIIVLGAEAGGPAEEDLLLSDELLQAAGEARLEILTEYEFWNRSALVPQDLPQKSLYTPAMLAELAQVPMATVRRWQRRGLIVPTCQVNKLPYYDFEQVTSARRLARWMANGQMPQLIESKLARLAELFPNLRVPLSQLAVIVDGRDILLRHGAGLVDPRGQLRIDFEALESGGAIAPQTDRGQAAANILQFPQAAPIDHHRGPSLENLDLLTSPGDFIRLAVDLEDAGRIEQAIEVYRAMGLAVGPAADICFRLGELLYQLGDLAGARERYSMAVELDGGYVEARASLGCVLLEQDQTRLAIAAFEGALDTHPEYPDVHFHLARALDQIGREHDAEKHWSKFLSLAPHSPWSDEARRRLDLLYPQD